MFMYNTEDKNNNIPQHKSVRNFKKHKVYDRAKDRKNKKLYEAYEEYEFDSKTKSIF